MKQIWYHKNCMDGFGALAAYSISYNFKKDDMMIPMSYGDSYNLEGVDEVIMLDFSVKEQVMREICSKVSKVLVIDHHKTAQEEFEKYRDIKNLELVFDTSKSGAILTWEYFHKNEDIPLILHYIQDRDLWEWKLSCSKEISAYLKHQGYKDNQWLQDLLSRKTLGYMSQEGSLILEVQKRIYEEICEKAKFTSLDDDLVISVNSPIFQSDIGDFLNQKIIDKNLPQKYVITWWDEEEDTVYSLRSKGDFDVSEVAKRYGGGGHKNAAGFKVNTKLQRRKNDGDARWCRS